MRTKYLNAICLRKELWSYVLVLCIDFNKCSPAKTASQYNILYLLFYSYLSTWCFPSSDKNHMQSALLHVTTATCLTLYTSCKAKKVAHRESCPKSGHICSLFYADHSLMETKCKIRVFLSPPPNTLLAWVS